MWREFLTPLILKVSQEIADDHWVTKALSEAITFLTLWPGKHLTAVYHTYAFHSHCGKIFREIFKCQWLKQNYKYNTWILALDLAGKGRHPRSTVKLLVLKFYFSFSLRKYSIEMKGQIIEMHCIKSSMF